MWKYKCCTSNWSALANSLAQKLFLIALSKWHYRRVRTRIISENHQLEIGRTRKTSIQNQQPTRWRFCPSPALVSCCSSCSSSPSTLAVSEKTHKKFHTKMTESRNSCVMSLRCTVHKLREHRRHPPVEFGSLSLHYYVANITILVRGIHRSATVVMWSEGDTLSTDILTKKLATKQWSLFSGPKAI